MHCSVYMSVPISQFLLLPFPLSIHAYVPYIGVSISALQIRSTVPFSRFYIHLLIYNICYPLSDWLQSVWQSSSIHISAKDTVWFLYMAEWYPFYIYIKFLNMESDFIYIKWFYIYKYIYIKYLLYSSVDGYLGCFHILTSSTAMNIWVYYLFESWFYLGICLGIKFLDHTGVLFLVF